MIRKTYIVNSEKIADQDALSAILDLIDMPLLDDNEALQWSLVDTGFNCYLELYLEVTDEYTDVYTRLYECDLSDLDLSMEAIEDALNDTHINYFESVDNESERDLFLKYE